MASSWLKSRTVTHYSVNTNEWYSTMSDVSMATNFIMMRPAKLIIISISIKHTIMAFASICIMLVLIIVFTYQCILHRQQQHPKMHQDTGQSNMVSPREEERRREEGKVEPECINDRMPPSHFSCYCIIIVLCMIYYVN